MEINPIAYIKTDFSEKFGIPRQSGRAANLTGKIVFCENYRDVEILRGIEEFSHLWLIFGFSEAQYKQGVNTVRPPRLGGNKRVGVFASRSPYRPNSLGLSVVKIEEIKRTNTEGTVLIVSGIDMLNDTPIYDIKPYIPHADCVRDAVGGYSDDFSGYSIKVDFPEELLQKIPKDKQDALLQCLGDDPRPSYQEDGRVYNMRFAEYDIKFTVENQILKVTDIKYEEKV